MVLTAVFFGMHLPRSASLHELTLDAQESMLMVQRAQGETLCTAATKGMVSVTCLAFGVVASQNSGLMKP